MVQPEMPSWGAKLKVQHSHDLLSLLRCPDDQRSLYFYSSIIARPPNSQGKVDGAQSLGSIIDRINRHTSVRRWIRQVLGNGVRDADERRE